MTASPAVYEHYFVDLAQYVKDLADAAKRARDAAADPSVRQFADGRLLGLHEVVSLMKEQAIAFNIPVAGTALAEVDPERDLV